MAFRPPPRRADMATLLSVIFDLISNMLHAPGLWTTLGMALMLLALTLVGLTGRVVTWLETMLSRG